MEAEMRKRQRGKKRFANALVAIAMVMGVDMFDRVRRVLVRVERGSTSRKKE